MHIHPALLIVWAGLAACLLALIAYKGQLTRYEEDQLFLNENVNQNEHKQQDEIVRKVNKIDPFVRLFAGATGLMTASVVGLFVWQAWQSLNR
jgi:hypothetical protein